MRTYRLALRLLFFILLVTTMALSEQPAFTNITVVAHEYYDYYAQPAAEWKKVKMLKIEGRNNAGNTSVYQNGPDVTLQATLQSVAVPSEYWVTVVWEGGERTSQSFVSNPQKEIVHHIHNP